MTLQVKLLFGALLLVNLAFFVVWFRSRKTYIGRKRPLISEYPVGFIFAFFDTVGIGSFAPTTAVLKFHGKLADELIPGTLNIGLNAAAMLEMFIMVSVIVIDPVLLMATVLSAALGAWVGAGVVNRLPPPIIQLIMGVALLIAGCVFAATNLHLLPGGGTAMTLTGWRLAVAVGANFVLGALMSVGIGLYAPCMIGNDASRTSSARVIPDHDGCLRTRAADCRPTILSLGTFRIWNVDRIGDRVDPRRAPCSVRGEAIAACDLALAGSVRRYLRGYYNAAFIFDGACNTQASHSLDVLYKSWHIDKGYSGLRGVAGVNLAALGIPDESSYVARYCERTGRAHPRHWDYYIIYNLFRLAGILQGIAARALQGNAANSSAAEFGGHAKPLAEIAWLKAQQMR
jgi:hypothetical protein